MRLAITGGTGLVGRFLVEEALSAGDSVTILSRHAPPPGLFSAEVAHQPYELTGSVPDLSGCDALLHAAFSHVPGRYRGGEGDDSEGFLRANLQGSLRLFATARRAGLSRLLFLSSRAAYGEGWPPGARLVETMAPRPGTLYGKVKLEAEQALAAMATPEFGTASLRVTGVYGPAGPGRTHKWAELFEGFAGGEPVTPRAATEVHGADLAAAIRLLLTTDRDSLGDGGLFNISDILLDRQDLLAEVARITGATSPLPERSDAARVNVMDTAKIEALGWRPGGMDRLRAALPGMIAG
ncbi:NAD-dependent epimerase/dehydratase family protein [Tropicimonas sediminicola]|uniref:Nucleoside-diphosphate-sugar epimerase n=1 Tax=Tropicimonas sediminicola TaxID=1031541 RepID=A0A239LUC1_9RHOB|nr:NAD(P)-dependent oxidoreductase [Tropicimonas sediminicola]SNT33478.1 Nucleoside-diphosphate-sugar epimerase [Tropicimonas sediminicola]